MYFLQVILRALIKFDSCFLLFKEKVFAVFSISSSRLNVNSSFSYFGKPLKVNKGLLWMLPLGVITYVASINPLVDKFFLSLIDWASSSTLIEPST